MAEDIVKSRYRVGGMDCAACAAKIDTAVRRLPGVFDVEVSFTAGTMTVSRERSSQAADIDHAVKWLGYTPVRLDTVAGDDAQAKEEQKETSGHLELGDGPWWRTRKAILTFSCGAALVAAYLVGLAFPAIGSWAFLAALLVGLLPVGRRAVTGALSGTPFSIETLMTIAAVGAVIIGATEEAATVVLLFLVGELLEGVAASRARASIRNLAELVPKMALVEQDGQTREVEAAGLTVGATILVRPGDRIAADGTILEGNSAIDESSVTGESVPKSKTVGDQVFAGTINTDAQSVASAGIIRTRARAMPRRARALMVQAMPKKMSRLTDVSSRKSMLSANSDTDPIERATANSMPKYPRLRSATISIARRRL
jgi:Zn2+/Cd2+-exporting ATPase